MARTSQTALIVALAVPSFMVGIDFTGAMLLVLPVAREFGADISTTQWILNAYALAVGMVVVAGGRLADMYGRRRAHLVGLALLFIGSLACAAAPSIGALIAARMVQGAGIALVVPATMAIGTTSVAVSARGLIVGSMLGAIAIGNVVAPFLSGASLALGDWRYLFAFNALLAAASVVAALVVLADDRPAGVRERVDLAGMVSAGLALFALLYALDIGSDAGWLAPQVLAWWAIAAGAAVAFVVLEHRVRQPMLPPVTMRNGQFLAALVLQGLPATAFFAILMYVPRLFEMTRGWSVDKALLAVVPCLAALALTNSTAGRFFNTLGPRALSLTGHTLVTVAMAGLALAMPGAPLGVVIAAITVATFGAGLIFGPMATGAVNAEAPERAGLVGGLNFVAHLTVGAVGIALATALITVFARARLPGALEAAGVTLTPHDLAALARYSAGSGDLARVLPHVSADHAAALQRAAGTAYASGLGAAFFLCAALAFIGVVLSAFLDDRRLGRVA
ncbi:MAG: hypothetical protein AcusKO_38360 [Acuticoccus sp.]